MHGNTVANVLKTCRARTTDKPILYALDLLEHLFHEVAAYKTNRGCKQCKDALTKDKLYHTEWRRKRKAKG